MMLVHAIGRIVDVRSVKDKRTYRFMWPYQEAFHGHPSCVVNRYGERPYTSLPIRRNLRIMPPVFFPGITMVVNEEVGRRLSVFDGVDLNECHWEAVYDEPVDESAIRARQERFSAMSDERGAWLKGHLKPPGENVKLPEYFQVIAPPLDGLKASFQCNIEITLPNPAYEELPPLMTSHILHNLYPVVRVAPYYLCNEAAWSVLEPHVRDRDLFTVQSFDLSLQKG